MVVYSTKREAIGRITNQRECYEAQGRMKRNHICRAILGAEELGSNYACQVSETVHSND